MLRHISRKPRRAANRELLEGIRDLTAAVNNMQKQLEESQPKATPQDRADSLRLRTSLGNKLRKRIEALPGESLLDDIADILNEFGLFKIAAIALGIVGVFTVWQDISERRKLNVYQAWDIINGAVGQSGDGGRKYAIEELYKSGEPLDGLNISGARIRGLNIGCTRVVYPACLSEGAQMGWADFQDATLWVANLDRAYLYNANLNNADLGGSQLQEVFFNGADLNGTILDNAQIKWAAFENADLQGASLVNANLYRAKLLKTNLSNANLKGADLDEAILLGTDLSTAKHLDRSQLEGEQSPLICAVSLPPHIENIDPNRDCDRIWISLVRRGRGYFDSRDEAEAYIQKVLEEQV